MCVRGVQGNRSKANEYGQYDILCNSDTYADHAPHITCAKRQWRRGDDLCPEEDTYSQEGQVFSPVMDKVVCEREIVEGRPVPDPGTNNQDYARDGRLSQPVPHFVKTLPDRWCCQLQEQFLCPHR